MQCSPALRALLFSYCHRHHHLCSQCPPALTQRGTLPHSLIILYITGTQPALLLVGYIHSRHAHKDSGLVDSMPRSQKHTFHTPVCRLTLQFWELCVSQAFSILCLPLASFGVSKPCIALKWQDVYSMCSMEDVWAYLTQYHCYLLAKMDGLHYASR